MKKIGLFYSFQTTRTAEIASNIEQEFLPHTIDKIDVHTMNFDDFDKYEYLIMGIPTWFDGELPAYWDELLPAMETIDWSSRNVALFGLGDQKQYPMNFGDAIGVMAEFLEQFQAKLFGFTSTEGYNFIKSAALRNDNFIGLIIDEDNQHGLSNDRIKNWVDALKTAWSL